MDLGILGGISNISMLEESIGGIFLILLDSTYISPLLSETLYEKDIVMCDIQQKEILGQNLVEEHDLENVFQSEELIIMNSEEAFQLLNEFHSQANITKVANLFKNKVDFRKCLSKIYPHFFFLEASMRELHHIDTEILPYPVILKPSIGYSSVGVYRIENKHEYQRVLENLVSTMQSGSENYSTDVLDTNSFIIESYIEGQEFAVDLYFDDNNEPVLLNVFSRMFKDEKDMSDRIYYTSKQILADYLAPISAYIARLNTLFDLRKMPLHIELRMQSNGEFIPIEINPLRFAGIGTTELGYVAYGVNPYHHFFEQSKPDWPQLIQAMDDKIYNFTCAEFDHDLKIDSNFVILHDQLKKQFDHILEYRHIPLESGSTFAVIFYSCDSLEQNNHILSLDFMSFVEKKMTISI